LFTIWVTPENELAKRELRYSTCFTAGFSGVPSGDRSQVLAAASDQVHNLTFIKQLERAHAHGWDIEVVSWDAGCNRYLRHFAQNHGAYRPLEPVYDKVTFINNKRWAQRV
jgi:hypothetical protein